MFRTSILLFSLLLFSKLSFSQSNVRIGCKVGLTYQVGQVVHRIGINAGVLLANNHFQVQQHNYIFYAFKNYGPSIPRLEFQSSIGGLLSIGPIQKREESMALLSPVSNFTKRPYAVSYSLKYYGDKIGTSQWTGIITARLQQFFFATENDGFVFRPWDKFRTGAIRLGLYSRHEINGIFIQQQRYSLNCLLYTGNTREGKRGIDTSFPARFGYKDMRTATFGNVSHGILSLQWEGGLPLQQNVYAEVGIDHEKIRNFLQNKVIHDQAFLPSSLIKIRNAHIPMLDTSGNSYLYKKNQHIRRQKLIWEFGFNPTLFY